MDGVVVVRGGVDGLRGDGDDGGTPFGLPQRRPMCSVGYTQQQHCLRLRTPPLIGIGGSDKTPGSGNPRLVVVAAATASLLHTTAVVVVVVVVVVFAGMTIHTVSVVVRIPGVIVPTVVAVSFDQLDGTHGDGVVAAAVATLAVKAKSVIVVVYRRDDP